MSKINMSAEGSYINGTLVNDLVSSTDKDMSNWNAVGDEFNIEYELGVNVIDYENNPKTPAQVLKEGLEEASGLPVTDSCITSLLSFWEQHQTLVLFYLQETNLGAHCWFGTQNDYIDTDGFHFNAGGYDLIMANPGNTSITGISQTNPVSNTGVFPVSSTIKMARVCSYDELNEGSFDGYIDKNFTVESGKKYYVTLKFKTTTGYNIASNNNFIITSGNNVVNIRFDNNVHPTQYFKRYFGIIQADGTTLNLKINLTSMYGDSIELGIYDIRIYQLGS